MCSARRQQVIISRMGAGGEGLCTVAGKTLNVPFTLPRETVEIVVPPSGRQARLVAVKQNSSERCMPQCRHFGLISDGLSQHSKPLQGCGGCLLQHWQETPYHNWKSDQVKQAFTKTGIVISAEQFTPLWATDKGTRRRLILSGMNTANGVVLGFNRYNSHEIIQIEECPVATPELVAALPFLRSLLALLKIRREAFHLIITQAENGLDIAFKGLAILTEAEKLALSDHVLNGQGNLVSISASAKIIRLTADEELIIVTEPPIIIFGGVAVALPAGGFLQAVRSAEEKMANLASKALGKCKFVADLFAGCGNFTFRLAANSQVHAVEWDKAALTALEQAASGGLQTTMPAEGQKQNSTAMKLKKITTERRDLFRQPLTYRELAAFDGLVFDPPRAGAQAQAEEIAKAQLKTVVAVSCNPITLARDIGILLAGGYELQSLTPIDQFLWSAHIEIVAVLSKRRPKKKWVL